MPYNNHQRLNGLKTTSHSSQDLSSTLAANSYSFNGNTQVLHPEAFGSGLPPPPFLNLAHFPHGSLPPPPFPPVPIPQHGFPAQFPIPSQNGHVKSAVENHTQQFNRGFSSQGNGLPIPQCVYVVGLEGDREEGELSDRDIKDTSANSTATKDRVHELASISTGSDRQDGRHSSSIVRVQDTSNTSRKEHSLQNLPYTQSEPSTESKHHDGYNITSTSAVPSKPASPAEDRLSGQHVPGRRASGPVVYARDFSPANRNRDAQQSSEVRWTQKTSIETNLPTGTRDHNNNSKFGRPRYSPTIGKPVLDIRKLAKNALLGLLPHSIRYADLLAAGVDETTLRSLYEEIGVKVPPQTPLTTTEENNNMGQKPSAGLTTSNGHGNEDENQHAPPITRPPPLLQSSSPRTVSLKPSGQDPVGPPGKDFGVPVSAPVKRQEEVKLGAKPSSLPVTNPAIKPNQPTMTSSKPLERKDYIARMLAAKNATAKTPSAHALSNQVPARAKGSPNEIPKDETGVSLETSNTKELPYSKPSFNGSKTIDSEGIKQAQTNLARQKMEALKNRTFAQPEQALPLRFEPQAPQATPPATAPSVAAALNTSPKSQQLVSSQPSSQPLQQTKQTYNSGQKSPRIPTVAPADNVQIGRAPFSGIPGLFMTSAPLAGTLGVASLTPNVTQQPSTAGTSSTNPRKRPLAADLNDLSTSTVKRPFGQTRQVEVVIDVSDDDIVDMADDSDMDIEDAEKDAISRQSQTITDNSAMKSVYDPLLPGDNSRRKSVVAASTLNTPSAPQTPGKGKRPEDLRSREEQIQLMHEKIAELEQRRKTKQSTSRAHTPATPRVPAAAPNPKPAPASEAKPPVQTEVAFEAPKEQLDDGLRADEPTAAEAAAAEETRATERKALEQRVLEQKALEQKALEHKALDQRASEQKLLDLEAAKIRAEQAELAIAEANAKRRRKAEIETGLPILDAEVQRTQIKLEEMKREISRLEEMKGEISRLELEVQKGLEGRKSLVEELEGLGVDTGDMPLAQLQAKKDEILELQQRAGAKSG